MDPKVIKEFNKTISSFDVILYSLKWFQQENKGFLEFNPIIDEFQEKLKQLKILCFNNIGIIDDEV